MSVYDKMSLNEKLKLANSLHAFLNPDKPFVRKAFKSTELADSTLGLLSQGVPREDLVRLMTVCGIKKAVIAELPIVPKVVGDEGKMSSLGDESKKIPDNVLGMMKAAQKVALYNAMYIHNHPDQKPVKRFKDSSLADTSLLCISRHFQKADILRYMAACKFPVAINKAMNDYTPAPFIPPSKEPKVVLRSEPEVKKAEGKLTPAARKLLKIAQEKEAKQAAKPIRHLKSELDSKGKPKVRLTLSAQCVLASIKTLLPVNKPKAELDTTQLATHLKTSTRCVCTIIRNELFTSRLVMYEDDTPAGGVEFLYIKLTQAGRDFEIEPQVKFAKLPAPTPGPKSKFARPAGEGKTGSSKAVGDKKLYKVIKENPRRVGTHGWKSFEALKDGMTYEQYKSAGGRNNDLSWDIAHGYIEVR